MKSIHNYILTATTIVAVVGCSQKQEAPAQKAEKPEVAANFVLNGDAARGKVKFDQVCFVCHGLGGKGDGPGGVALNPRPRDFTDHKIMDALMDEHIYKVIRDGAQSVGKSPLMVPWKATLTDQEIRDCAAYVRTFAK